MLSWWHVKECVDLGLIKLKTALGQGWWLVLCTAKQETLAATPSLGVSLSGLLSVEPSDCLDELLSPNQPFLGKDGGCNLRN